MQALLALVLLSAPAISVDAASVCAPREALERELARAPLQLVESGGDLALRLARTGSSVRVSLRRRDGTVALERSLPTAECAEAVSAAAIILERFVRELAVAAERAERGTVTQAREAPERQPPPAPPRPARVAAPAMATPGVDDTARRAAPDALLQPAAAPLRDAPASRTLSAPPTGPASSATLELRPKPGEAPVSAEVELSRTRAPADGQPTRASAPSGAPPGDEAPASTAPPTPGWAPPSVDAAESPTRASTPPRLTVTVGGGLAAPTPSTASALLALDVGLSFAERWRVGLTGTFSFGGAVAVVDEAGRTRGTLTSRDLTVLGSLMACTTGRLSACGGARGGLRLGIGGAAGPFLFQTRPAFAAAPAGGPAGRLGLQLGAFVLALDATLLVNLATPALAIDGLPTTIATPRFEGLVFLAAGVMTP